MSEAEWQLFYWPGFPGRGDYVRLMFEEAGVAYEDVGPEKGVEEVQKYYLNQHEGNRVAAPPIIRHKTDGFVMCATPAILVYLGEKFGMSPENTAEERAYALQVKGGGAVWNVIYTVAGMPVSEGGWTPDRLDPL